MTANTDRLQMKNAKKHWLQIQIWKVSAKVEREVALTPAIPKYKCKQNLFKKSNSSTGKEERGKKKKLQMGK